MSADGLVQTHVRRQSLHLMHSQVLKVYEVIGSEVSIK